MYTLIVQTLYCVFLYIIMIYSQRGLPMIYLPLHRSHLDYVLMTFIFWHYKIKTPYVAAGINLNIPVFG